MNRREAIAIKNEARFILPPHTPGEVLELIVGSAEIQTSDAQLLMPHFTKEELPEINRITLTAIVKDGVPYWLCEPSA